MDDRKTRGGKNNGGESERANLLVIRYAFLEIRRASARPNEYRSTKTTRKPISAYVPWLAENRDTTIVKHDLWQKIRNSRRLDGSDDRAKDGLRATSRYPRYLEREKKKRKKKDGAEEKKRLEEAGHEKRRKRRKARRREKRNKRGESHGGGPEASRSASFTREI